MRCPSCGNLNRAEARFCDSCGSELAAAPATATGERPPQTAPERPERAPELIAGRYAVVDFLGRGGRKRVYRARDLEASEREVAVAVFETEGIEETVLARARREAQAMAKLGDHPHVVGVLDSGEEGRVPYIVSEYVGGGDLAGTLEACEGRRLEIERAIAIAVDVCRALEHAHSRGIVHRDLKPANVWLGDDGSARLGDFGLAATDRRSRAAVEGMLVGTVAYLPPEQALGRSSDARADLYSLGAMLYELLTGEPPFPGEDAVTIIGQHLSADPVAPSRHRPEISGELDRLILSLLAKDPDDRPETAAAARRQLEALASGAASGPPDPGENPLDQLAGGVFVGRERELDEMRGVLEDALAGQGRLLLLSGDPGIGKTRTAEQLATYARVAGRERALGPLPRVRGGPALLALVGGDPLLRPRRRPRRPALAARRPRGGDRPDRPRARPAPRGSRRGAADGGRAGALPALRRRRRLPRRSLAHPPAGARARRPALGRRALAAAAAVPHPAPRRHRAARRRHLPRHRARPPPPARRHARRPERDRGDAADLAARPRAGGDRELHRAHRRGRAPAARPRGRDPHPDRRQPVLHRRGRAPARLRGQPRRGRRAPRGIDPPGRARGRRPAPRPPLADGERGPAAGRRLRARVRPRGPGPGQRPRARADRGGARRGGGRAPDRRVAARARALRLRPRARSRDPACRGPRRPPRRDQPRDRGRARAGLRRQHRRPPRRARPPLSRGRAGGRHRARGRLRDPRRRPRHGPARPRGRGGPVRSARSGRSSSSSPSIARGDSSCCSSSAPRRRGRRRRGRRGPRSSEPRRSPASSTAPRTSGPRRSGSACSPRPGSSTSR